MPARLLVVSHSRSGHTDVLRDRVLEGAREVEEDLDVVSASPFDVGPEDVLAASGIVLGTPANFGYMSGALKDFFERIYHPLLDRTQGLAYTLFVKGDTDTDGAVASVEKIVTALRWRRVLPTLTVVGDVTASDLEEAFELGASFAAGLSSGIF